MAREIEFNTDGIIKRCPKVKGRVLLEDCINCRYFVKLEGSKVFCKYPGDIESPSLCVVCMFVLIALAVNSIIAYMMWREGFASPKWFIGFATPLIIALIILVVIPLMRKLMRWAKRQSEIK